MSENWKIQYNVKLGEDLLNIRGETPDEFFANLQAVGAQAQNVLSEIGLFKAAKNLAPVTQPQAQQAPAPQQGGWQTQQTAPLQFPQQPQAQAPSNGGPVCEHGPYVWKDFVSKKGNAVKGFFCTGSNTQCKPDFRK